MKRNIFAFALVAVVLVAGCTTTEPSTVSTKSTGISINGFSVNPAEARSGQTVLAKLEIQNDGQRDVNATDYFALLISGSEWTTDSAAKSKPSPLRYARGDEKPVPQIFTWNVKAPPSRGIDTPSDFTGRVYYKYQTEAVNTVSIYPASEQQTATDKTSNVVSKGPIELVVEVNPDPPVIFSPGDEFTVSIKVKNIGGGVVYGISSDKTTPSITDQTIEQERLGKVTLSVPALPSNLEWTDTSCFENIQFFGTSKEETTTCGIRVKTMPQAKSQVTMRFIANYGYYIDAKSNVVLKAR